MDFTMASQMKAGKIAADSRSSQQKTVQKGTGDKPNVTKDSLSVAKAVTAPKVTSGYVSAHKGDVRTAPKTASSFENDRQVQAGEFESEVAPSTADTGISGKAVLDVQSGEFESVPQASHAESGGSWGEQPVETAADEVPHALLVCSGLNRAIDALG
ncbi:SMP domain-containing protein [Balamuthia mandrillaris]